MSREKTPKPTYETCRNTVIYSKSTGKDNKGFKLSFSCPRIPRVETSSESVYLNAKNNISTAKSLLREIIGDMCVSCSFRDQNMSLVAETSVTPSGKILEQVSWTPVAIQENPESTHKNVQ